tara:strand:+ start:290 stop:484 length:195 start_codon:yes stop_codon:yes gene_type:complete
MGIAGIVGPTKDPEAKLVIGKLLGTPGPIAFCCNVNTGAMNAVFVVGGMGGILYPTTPPVGTIP